MLRNSYDYSERKGVLPISWQDFHGLCKALAQAAAGFAPDLILPIGRGGYYPGTLIAHMLQVDVYPVRVSRRVHDVVQFQSPRWLMEPLAQVKGQRVLVVDEICSHGETIRMVKGRVEALGAAAVKSAVLYTHTSSAHIPDYIGLISDALLLNPWDREVLRDGEFHFHPDYVKALEQQGLPLEASLLIPATPYTLAKG